MEQLAEQIAMAGFLDWLALLTSLAYVWLAARDNNWCWLFAGVSTAVWAWQSFIEYQLISDGFLQLFYFVMAGIGLWRWREMKRGEHRQKRADAGTLDEGGISERRMGDVVRMSTKEHAIVIIGSLTAGLFLNFLVSTLFTSFATLPDAMTTAFSIATTFLLIGRRLENWLYWIVIDAVYVWIYAGTGAVLFAAMMIINIGMACYGFFQWRGGVQKTEQATY